MLRWSRAIAGSILTLLMIGISASPGIAAVEAPRQWWFDNWGVVDRLWPATKGRGVTVGLIDSGVQANLPELAGVVLPGKDFEGGGGDGRTDGDTFETKGHGTGMATLIAAQGGGTGMRGVAPGAKILPLVAHSGPAYVKAVRFAADRGVGVVNLSQAVAGSCPKDLQDSIAYALSKNVVVVAGAGNEGDKGNGSMHPANCKGVLAVGAADVDLNPWKETQRQDYVTIAAPGVLVHSVVRDGSIQFSHGTSDASALTSAVVALVRSKFPDMPNREVVRQIIASAKDIPPAGRDSRTGFGFIRPYRIFNGTIPKTSPNPVFADYDRLAKLKPPAAQPSKPVKWDSVSNTTIIGFSVFILGSLAAAVFAFFYTRRKRRSAPNLAQPFPPPQGRQPPYPSDHFPPPPGRR